MHMKFISRLLAGLLCSVTLPALADTYNIDTRHTFPVFEVDHLGFTTQRGRFNKVSGKLELNAAKDVASVDVTIDANSIDMGLDEWNKHMRAERFFNTEKHPELRFVAKQFPVAFDKPVAINGELTLLGVTRPVTLSVSKMRCAKHPVLPRELCGADLQTTIKRSEFGMTYGVPGIGDEIRVLIPVEAIKDS
jgi:polyisoprenoid-binding protein YceI